MATDLTDRIAALRQTINVDPRSDDSSAFPLAYLLYLYARTPRSAYMEETWYFRRLYNWLAPIAKPPEVDTKLWPVIFEGRIQRYIANMTSVSLPTLQYTLLHEVIPRLRGNYDGLR